MSAWKPDGAAFCWQPKEAFRRIEEGTEQPGSAISVYVALTRIASNEEGQTFTKPIAYIAKLACVERRTVERRLPELEQLGLVSVERRQIPGTKANDAHRYTLTTLSRKEVATPSRKLATGNPDLKSQLEKKRIKEDLKADPASPALRASLDFNAMRKGIL